MSSSVAANRHAGLSANDAELLSKICFLHQRANPKITAQVGDHLWVTKARADWCLITGLTLTQYDRSATRLRRRGLIVTEQHIRYGKAITFIRPTQVTQECATQVTQKCGTYVQQICVTSKEEPETEHEIEDDLSAALLCSHSAVGSPEGLLQEEVKQAAQQEPPYPPAPLPPGESAVATVAEIAKIAEATKLATREKNRKITVDPTAKDNPGALHLIWKQAMGEIDQHVGPMTGETGGMLKTLVGKCPPGVARAALPFVVSEWNSFKVTLEHDYGLWNVATKPVLPLLVKHSDKLVTWYLRRQKEEALHEAHKAPGASAAPTLPANGSAPATAQKSGVGAPVKPPIAEEDIPGSPTHRFESLLDIYDGDLARTKEEWLAKNPTLPAKYAETV